MAPIIVDMPSMSLAEYRTFSWALIRKTRKGLLAAPFFGILVFALNALADARYRTEPISGVTIIVGVALLPLLYGFFFYVLNRSIGKTYASTPILADGMGVVLAEDSIQLYSKAVTTKHPWPTAAKRVVKLANWYVLASGPSSAYLLDANQIEAPATAVDLEALFQLKGLAINK